MCIIVAVDISNTIVVDKTGAPVLDTRFEPFLAYALASRE